MSREEQPGLVIRDLVMPNREGIEATDEIAEALMPERTADESVAQSVGEEICNTLASGFIDGRATVLQQTADRADQLDADAERIF